MAFQFRFTTLLQLHRRRRDDAGIEVSKANEAIRRVEQEFEAIAIERQRLLEQAGRARTGTISIDSVLAHGRYEVQLQSDLNSLRETRNQLELELERRQQSLIDAEAEVKKLERLEENERIAHERAFLKREQAALDEATTTRYLMERRK